MAKKTAGRSPGPALCRAWRESQDPNVSQAALGKIIGSKDGSDIQLYERKRRHLTLEKLVRLSRHIGVPVEQLAWPHQVALLREASSLMSAVAPEANGDAA